MPSAVAMVLDVCRFASRSGFSVGVCRDYLFFFVFFVVVFLFFCFVFFFCFFFNDTATPEIYTLSLHDALPISTTDLVESLLGMAKEWQLRRGASTKAATARAHAGASFNGTFAWLDALPDRKSTRLNSGHVALSRMPSSA